MQKQQRPVNIKLENITPNLGQAGASACAVSLGIHIITPSDKVRVELECKQFYKMFQIDPLELSLEWSLMWRGQIVCLLSLVVFVGGTFQIV